MLSLFPTLIFFFFPFPKCVATLYRKIVRQLHHSDYLRQQYSVYIQDAVTAWETWLAGALLSDIEPRGIIQTTAQDLSLIRVPHRILYNITQHMVPGGALFPKPQGLTPVRVIADEEWQNFVRAPIVVQNIVQLPTGVHESDEAWNPENWRT